METFPRSTAGLEMRTAGRETIVHDPAHDRLHVLNGTAARILGMCDGSRSLEHIAHEISTEAGAPYDLVYADVQTIVTRFGELHLLG